MGRGKQGLAVHFEQGYVWPGEGALLRARVSGSSLLSVEAETHFSAPPPPCLVNWEV